MTVLILLLLFIACAWWAIGFVGMLHDFRKRSDVHWPDIVVCAVLGIGGPAFVAFVWLADAASKRRGPALLRRYRDDI